MKNNRRCFIFSLLILILFVVFSNSFIFGYNWPISDFSGPHPINGTLGEWREGHLHKGVDIGCGVSTPVYAIDSGVASRYDVEGSDNAGVIVANKAYIHLVPNTRIADGTTVTAGQLIGETRITHVHLTESNGGANPLRVGGLDNYGDTTRTYVSTLEFFKQGTETQLSGAIYGQVDILSQAWDAQSYGRPTVSVYRIGYQVQDSSERIVLSPLYNLQFDSVVGGLIDLVYANFGTHQSDKNTYYYWVTNGMSENRYWNTKLRAGQQWDGADARVNSESTYQDGKYKVSTLAYDIKENGGDLTTQEGAITEEITIDNFRPYVQKVTIGNKYSREWTFDGTNLNSDKASIDEVLKTDKYTITVIFSEPVISATLLIDTFGAITLSSSEPVNNQKTFTGVLNIPSGDSKHDGQRTMTISTTDLAGNQTLQITGGTTQINPATQLTRDSSGNMQGTGGKDILHEFKIDATPYITALSIISTNTNFTDIRQGDTIKVEIQFSESMDMFIFKVPEGAKVIEGMM